MILCPKLKLGFIHVYKTGGTSVTRLLTPYTVSQYRREPPRLSGGGWQENWHVDGAQHSTFADNAERLAGVFDEDWRFVTISRHPLTWFASVFYEFYYKDLGNAEGGNFIFGQASKTRSFEDFVQFYYDFKPEHPRLWGFYPQKFFVEGVPREKLRVIRFENFPSDVATVLGRFGVQSVAAPHELDEGAEKAEMTSRLQRDARFRDFVLKEFAEDFEFYGYDPNPKQSRSSKLTDVIRFGWRPRALASLLSQK